MAVLCSFANRKKRGRRSSFASPLEPFIRPLVLRGGPGSAEQRTALNFSAGQGEEFEDIVVPAPSLQHARKILFCESSRRSDGRQLSEAIQCLLPKASEAG